MVFWGSVTLCIILIFMIYGSLGGAFKKKASFQEKQENLKLIKLFSKSFPWLKKIFVFSCYVYLIYIIFSFFLTSKDYIDNIFSNENLIIILVPFSFLSSILFFISVNNYIEAPNELKDKMPFLIVTIILLIFLNSLMMSLIFIDFTNKIFDFSKGEEKIVNITKKEIQKGKITTYYLYFTPSISNVNQIESYKGFYYSVEEGDDIKIKIYKGFLGLRYIGKQKELVTN